jgi:hypothetical protein
MGRTQRMAFVCAAHGLSKNKVELRCSERGPPTKHLELTYGALAYKNGYAAFSDKSRRFGALCKDVSESSRL